MRWVAPSEKDTANEVLEKRLWAAADQFRANSGLKAGQNSIRINNQWRICFVWKGGDAYDVEIADYH